MSGRNNYNKTVYSIAKI